MKKLFQCALASLLTLGFSLRVWAGGSGLNVVVVVNQDSTNSVELGNYYCEKRGVPPQNVLRINWPGGIVNWTRAEFETTLRAPLTNMLASRQLTNQIDYVLLSMGLPFRVMENTGSPVTSGGNSTTSALFYGFKPDGCSDCPLGLPSCNLAPASSNSYAGSEAIYRQTPPLSASSNNWMVMMLTSSNLALAKALVDRGVLSDGSFPTQTVYLAKSTDIIRNRRYLTFDDAIFDGRLRGNYSIIATNLSSSFGLTGLLGFQNGVQFHPVSPNTFVPGALADNLTSFGGAIFENSGHVDVLDYLIGGATASYGTVVEPCAYFEKFPSPRNYFYQARGFSAAECYYQSVTNPYQGLLVGEPLAAPFAAAADGGWITPPDALLTGTTNLALEFSSVDSQHPLQQVDLFVNGLFARTVTNLPPWTNNIIHVTLNGIQTNYLVPASATPASIASNLAARLNQNAFSNATQVGATAHGDRIELHGLNVNVPGANLTVSVSNSLGAATLLTTRAFASRGDSLDTTARGIRQFTIVGQVVTNDYLQLTVTRTNGAIATLSVTNQTASSGNLVTDMQIFAQSLVNAVNAHAALAGADGVMAADLVVGQIGSDPAAEFNLRARAVGWKEAQIQAQLTGTFTISPTMVGRLEDNLNDLRPRNHIYVTAGLTNLTLPTPFNTTTNADGYHELTAVGYEGSHVRTQKRVTLPVRIQNLSWSATLTPSLSGTNAALEATLEFTVTVSTNSIANIELFSTGGLLANAAGVSNAVFSVAATNLGVGLHPFYALVTRSDGKQYRTETRWLRIVGPESPFAVSIASPAPTLAWPATAGRSYQVLSTTNITDTFLPRAIVIPTNSSGLWSETNNSSPQRFYRVKTP